MPSGSDKPDTEYVVHRGCLPEPCPPERLIYTSRNFDNLGAPRLAIWRNTDTYRCRINGVGDYNITANSIHVYPTAAVHNRMLESYLLSALLSWLLEWEGVPALHASAVSTDTKAIAFLAESRGGKSGLAAAFLKAGFALHTDDVLPIEYSDGEYLARPGYPLMRMWADEAEYFLGRYEHLEFTRPSCLKRRVPIGNGGFGRFCSKPKPISRIYLPQRRNPHEYGLDVRIEPIAYSEAIIALARHSVMTNVMEVLGWQSERLGFFSRFVRQVPVYRLIYPSGFDHLEQVYDVILSDIEK